MARPRSRTGRTVAGWNCDDDLLERIESIPNRSRFINRVLRDYFRMPLIPEAEEHVMANNQRIRNLDMVLGYMAIHKFSQRGPLERRIELECGVTSKKANEYLDLLIMNDQLVRSGHYIVLAGWKPADYPYPGTEAFIRWMCDRDLAAIKARSASTKPELKAEELAILEAAPAPPCPHTNHPFACKTCGSRTCSDCSASHEEASGIISGACKECG